MLVIKYEKLGRSIYISHLDMVRHMQRTMKRAGIDVDMSKGFNPHPLLYFAPPSPIGQESRAEYCSVITNDVSDDLKSRLQNAAIDGINILSVKFFSKNPNYAAIVFWAEYSFDYDERVFEKIQAVMKSKSFVITTQKKGEIIQKDVRDLIKDCKVVGDKIFLTLALGDKTLRADKFFEGIEEPQIRAVRERIFMLEGEELLDVDNFEETSKKMDSLKTI